MAKRGGPSLSVKMILTTTVLIVVTVVGSGVLNVMNVRRVFDTTTKQRIEDFKSGRESFGESFAPLLARTVEQPLASTGDDSPLRKLFAKTVVTDTKPMAGNEGETDYGLRFAMVLDLNQAVVAHCFEDAK